MSFRELLDPATTLAATFIGAWLAFKIENRRTKSQEEQQRSGVANRAIFSLYYYWNTLEQFRKESIEPHRNRPDAWLNMNATPPLFVGLTKLEAGELSFLLQTGHAEIYSNLMLEEQRFRHAYQLIEMRSSLVLNEVFPRLAAAGAKVGSPMAEADIEQALGVDIVHKLKVLTSGIVSCVDEDLKSLVAAHDSLRAAMLKIYPKRKVVKVEFSLPNGSGRNA